MSTYTRCIDCRALKPAHYFYNEGGHVDGLPYCVACLEKILIKENALDPKASSLPSE